MARPAPHLALWGTIFGLGAAALAGTVIYVVVRRKDGEIEGVESTYVDPAAPAVPAAVVTRGLAAPLGPPLRRTTPHGYYNAPRPTGSTPGDGKFDHYHQGVDLQGQPGEPVLAIGNGRIVDAKAGLGETVRVLLLDDGRAVVYADLGSATVEPGQAVRVGDQVGTVRKNGFVHVAVRESRYGKFINPKGVIPFAG